MAKRNAVSSGYSPIPRNASCLDFAEALRYGTYMQMFWSGTCTGGHTNERLSWGISDSTLIPSSTRLR
jgi:hypothetical protein